MSDRQGNKTGCDAAPVPLLQKIAEYDRQVLTK
jgi:hypothetical protein